MDPAPGTTPRARREDHVRRIQTDDDLGGVEDMVVALKVVERNDKNGVLWKGPRHMFPEFSSWDDLEVLPWTHEEARAIIKAAERQGAVIEVVG